MLRRFRKGHKVQRFRRFCMLEGSEKCGVLSNGVIRKTRCDFTWAFEW